jgi:hypothetical protein
MSSKVDSAKQGLAGHGANRRARLNKMWNALAQRMFILNRRAKLDVMGPSIAPRDHAKRRIGAFCKQEPVEPGRVVNEPPQARTMKIQVVACLKYVAHRPAEYAAPNPASLGNPVPPDGIMPVSVVKEASLAIRAPCYFAFASPFGVVFCVAVVAGGRHLGATPPRVEGIICPVDS